MKYSSTIQNTIFIVQIQFSNNINYQTIFLRQNNLRVPKKSKLRKQICLIIAKGIRVLTRSQMKKMSCIFKKILTTNENKDYYDGTQWEDC